MTNNNKLDLILERLLSLEENVADLRTETKTGLNEVNKRLDIIGKELAELQDDAPTLEDHEDLAKRVDKLEDKVASI